MTLSDFKRAVNGYLAKAAPKAALEFMTASLKEEASAQNTIILQKSRLTSLQRKIDANTIGQHDAELESNRITAAVIGMLDDIEEKDLLIDGLTIEESRSQGKIPQGRSAEEREGIERAIALKVRIINALREKLALEDDPIRLIRYEEDLLKAEDELRTLKAKLA